MILLGLSIGSAHVFHAVNDHGVDSGLAYTVFGRGRAVGATDHMHDGAGAARINHVVGAVFQTRNLLEVHGMFRSLLRVTASQCQHGPDVLDEMP